MAYNEVRIEVIETAGTGNVVSRYPVIGVLDVFKDSELPIALCYQVKDINNLDESTGAFTRTFDIPATPNNNKILEHVREDTLVNHDKFVQLNIQCRVKVNNLVVLTGQFQVKSILAKGKTTAYNVSILGDAKNWVNSFQNPMCDTEFDSLPNPYKNANGEYTWTSSLWKSINDNVTDSDDFNWCMPHICWGMYTHQQPDPAGGGAERSQMWLTENTPSIFVKNLLYQYFQEAGYNLVSAFFLTDFFKKLVMPLGFEHFTHDMEQTEEAIFRATTDLKPSNYTDAIWKPNDEIHRTLEAEECFGMYFGGSGTGWNTQKDYMHELWEMHSAPEPCYNHGSCGMSFWATFTQSMDPLSTTVWSDIDHKRKTQDNSRILEGDGAYGCDYVQISYPMFSGTLITPTRLWEHPNRCTNPIPFNKILIDTEGTGSEAAVTYQVPFGKDCLYVSPYLNAHRFRGLIGSGTGLGGYTNCRAWNARYHGGSKYSKSVGTPAYMTENPSFELSNVKFGNMGEGYPCPNDWFSTAESAGSAACGYPWNWGAGGPYYPDPPFTSGPFQTVGLEEVPHLWYHFWNPSGTSNDEWGSGGSCGIKAFDESPTTLGDPERHHRFTISGTNTQTHKLCYPEFYVGTNFFQHFESVDIQTRESGIRFPYYRIPKNGSYKIKLSVPMLHRNCPSSGIFDPDGGGGMTGIRVSLQPVNFAGDIANRQVLDFKVVQHKPQYHAGYHTFVYTKMVIEIPYQAYEKDDIIIPEFTTWMHDGDGVYTGTQGRIRTDCVIDSNFAKRLNSQCKHPNAWDGWCDDPDQPKRSSFGVTEECGNSHAKQLLNEGPWNTFGDDDYNTPEDACGIMMQSFPYDQISEQYTVPDPLFEVFKGKTIEHMDEWSFPTVLPCTVRKMDFISGLTGLFNLHWYTNELSKTVYCEPFETFYTKKNKAVDWSKKVDFNVDSNTSFLVDKISKEMIFRYIEDGADGYVNELGEMMGYPWHSHGVEFGDAFLPEVIEYGTTFFSPTYMIDDYELTMAMASSQPPWVPLIISEYIPMIEKTSPKPEREPGMNFRILSYEGMRSTGDLLCYGSWNWNVPHPLTGVNGDVSEYPCAVSWDRYNPISANLSYSDCLSVATTKEGLFNMYWKTFLNMLATSPRLKTIGVLLTPSDVSNLDLRNLVRLTNVGGAGTTYWIVHKIIDYQPTLSQPTIVELLQVNLKSNRAGIASGNNTGTVNSASLHSGNWGGNNQARLGGGSTTMELLSPSGSSAMRKDGINSTVIQTNVGNKAPSNSGITMFGHHLQSRLQGQIVLGQYNEENNDAILIVGGGTATDRRNVLTVNKDGSIDFGSKGGGTNMMTVDTDGNYIDMYTENLIDEEGKEKTIRKVIK